VRGGDRDAPAACAHVGDAQRTAGFPRPGHRELDEQLGVRVRDEDGRRHLEVQGHELLVADHISHRLTFCAPSHLRTKHVQLLLRQGSVELQIQVKAPQPKRAREHHLGIESR
jgi:hypothetical protein